ncbi:uncharacterized protein LOC124887898 [Capsicum annuum]|uniref:uncharacterized protein LOC124887898 n=1 Tax=Capsicum annuum TaxID=4072 RepID=UPI001FB195F4|nr:uncharacterized protein LOC124887898 [Capsicum annuum]
MVATNISTTSRTSAPQAMAPAEKPEKFTGIDFKRFTSEEAPELPEETSDQEQFFVMETWKHSDLLCRNYILSGLQDNLYNVYSGMKMSKRVVEFGYERGIFQVATIIEKLLPMWNDFKNYLKHKQKKMIVEDLIVRLHIEEGNKAAERRSKKNSAMHGANIVEDDHHNSKKWLKARQESNQPKKKLKRKCFNCGEINHKSTDCRALKKGKKKDQANMAESKNEIDNLCVMMSECSLVGNI